MTALILPNGKTQFIDQLGNPLVGGTVAFYIPTTTTPKDTWQDIDQMILNTNPVVLDARGQAIIWGDGAYRQIVKDALANLIWDEEVSVPTGSATAGDITASGLTMNTNRVLARWDAGVGAIEEATPTVGLALTTSGDLVAVPRSAPLVDSFGATLAWNSDNYDLYEATAQDTDLIINADFGDPLNGQKWIIRITDNGTPSNLTWTEGSFGFRAIGIVLPTITVASKFLTVGCIYNDNANVWDALALGQES